jgi:hypothetical protein
MYPKYLYTLKEVYEDHGAAFFLQVQNIFTWMLADGIKPDQDCLFASAQLASELFSQQSCIAVTTFIVSVTAILGVEGCRMARRRRIYAPLRSISA